MSRATQALLFDLLSRLGKGRHNAIPGSVLAADLRVDERTIRELVGELIEDGHLVGSTCRGATRGYFAILDEADLDEGTAHLRSRALSMLKRYRAVQRAAEARFGEQVLRLFDLDEEERRQPDAPLA